MYEMHSIRVGDYTLDLWWDQDTQNPREDGCNLGTLYAEHRNYKFGEKNFDDWEEDKCKMAVSLPVYMYEHSGIALGTTPFSCMWDSGQLGWIGVTREKLLEEYPSWKRLTQKRLDQVKEYLENEIKVYGAYVAGEGWGWTLRNEAEDEELDSCGGFLGGVDAMEQYLEYWKKDLGEEVIEEMLEEAADQVGRGI